MQIETHMRHFQTLEISMGNARLISFTIAELVFWNFANTESESGFSWVWFLLLNMAPVSFTHDAALDLKK